MCFKAPNVSDQGAASPPPLAPIHHAAPSDRARRGVAQEAELQAVKDKMSKEAEKHKRWHAKSAKDTEGFLKKVKKEHMIPVLNDFGVPTKGSKEELSTLLAEQLHYETDSGDDE